MWGECRGSAAAPYRTVVDLSGPAYRCSCPSPEVSRASTWLALLLLWSEGSVPDDAAGPPEWAGSWLMSRASRPSRAPAGDQAEPKDPRAAARRAEQRETRVASGLAELDRWLGDQVRQGLAASQQAGYAHWDEIAARMVDAQAPGLAERLRALASVPHSGTGWDGLALEEYALLHLLAVAYRLGGPSCRRRYGPPSGPGSASASARPTCWPAGSRSGSTGKGAGPARPRAGPDPGPAGPGCTAARPGGNALLLSFAAAGQALDDSLAVGAETDADLVFYPGAVPLRAAVLARHDDSDGSDGGASGGAPLDAGPPDGGTIAGLLGGYAAALAADPWLDSWLAVVEIIPVAAPSRPCATRTAAACRCTRGPATAGRCSRSPAAAR